MADDNEPEQFEEEQQDSSNDSSIKSAIEQRDKAVSQALTGGDKFKALTAALEDPPYATKDPTLRNQSGTVVAQVLLSAKEAEMKGLVEKLTPEQQDLLMKYIYRILENVDKSNDSATILKWHAVLTELAGVGCIVRALSERKSV